MPSGGSGLQARGWHPFRRINRQSQHRPDQQIRLRPLSQVITQVGQRWAGAVTGCTTCERQVTGALLAHWDAPWCAPWLIRTDRPPAAADVVWDARRAGIACGCNDAERRGRRWEQTKMRDPRRAERLWLAMAVATLWTVSVGGQAEARRSLPVAADLPTTRIARQQPRSQQRPRTLSCFRRGRLALIATLTVGQEPPQGRFLPEPRPTRLDTHIHRPPAYRPLAKAA